MKDWDKLDEDIHIYAYILTLYIYNMIWLDKVEDKGLRQVEGPMMKLTSFQRAAIGILMKTSQRAGKDRQA